MFKFDEQSTNVHQHQRKDSASSEVAALLSISGRTSRISSVGSQGSAVSRLSAISGVSRSPSPHRMLLETSFCGPKPVDSLCDSSIISGDESPAEILEQVILSRKHDPTQAVLAEGIQIDLTASPKRNTTSNGIESKLRRKVMENPEVKVTKPTNNPLLTSRTGVTGGPPSRKPGAKKDPTKAIVGVTPSGTEYIRINLKPDHLYGDKGLGENERILDEPLDEIFKKPVSLNLNKKQNTDPALPITPSTIKNASPKPARHMALARDQGSRSPSPATVTVSRKSSFCSLFKSKDTIASPDSPRDRSRSKSRDRETQPTPNKQKSVLAIFKPTKKAGSKSKSTSPVDPESASQVDGRLSQLDFRFQPAQSCANTERESRSRQRLRYYDEPLEGNVIHIPLHTPPDEKDILKNDKLMNADKIEKFTDEIPAFRAPSTKIKEKPVLSTLEKKSPAQASVSSSSKCYRFENPDGSITIPLHSPPNSASISNNESREVESIWSMEVQRHSSQESQETVISTSQPPACPQRSSSKVLQRQKSTDSSNNIALTTSSSSSKATTPPQNIGTTNTTTVTGTTTTVAQVITTTNGGRLKKNSLEQIKIPSTAQINNCVGNNVVENNKQVPAAPPPTPASATRDKKHILFSTKIGSGSEEQIFCTQFSLSKTESLSSQISEQAECATPTAIPTNLPHDEEVQVSLPPTVVEVKMRQKKPQTLQEELCSAAEHFVVKIPKEEHRHSKYIENIDEIMEAQKKLTASLTKRKKQDDKLSDDDSPIIDHHKKPTQIQPTVETPKPLSFEETPITNRGSIKAVSSSDYHGSSESEKESETESSVSSTRMKRHLPRNMGAIEDHESTGLVSQQSFDEDLPYVPTTLPEERSVGVSLIPVKERARMDIKTCPVDRPRSTTPINPASLEEYCGTISNDDHDILHVRGEKLKISLPRRNSKDRDAMKQYTPVLPPPSGSSKSPRRISTSSQKSWFDFAAGANKPTATGTPPTPPIVPEDDQPPPPLPPRKPITITTTASTTSTTTSTPSSSGGGRASATTAGSQQWINFEDIPEKKKMPKKITALPVKEQPHHVQYNYVNPEDCQCECHENERASNVGGSSNSVTLVDEIDQEKLLQQQQPNPPEDVQPLLEPDHSDCIDRTRYY